MLARVSCRVRRVANQVRWAWEALVRKQRTLRLETLLFSFSVRPRSRLARLLVGLLLIGKCMYHGGREAPKAKGPCEPL